jgi:hypothetical protein
VARKPLGRQGDPGPTPALNGDEHLPAVRFGPPLADHHERGGLDADLDWVGLRLFSEAARVNWSNPNLRLVDLDGMVRVTCSQLAPRGRCFLYDMRSGSLLGFGGTDGVLSPTGE